MMQNRRVAIVTGGCRGIGLGIARRLSSDGMRVYAWDLATSIDGVTDEDRRMGSDNPIVPELVDVSEPDEVARAVSNVVERDGRIDVLVNNAGISPKTNGERTPPDETSLEEWDLVIKVNLTGPFLCIREVVPHMKRQRWGRIVNISSRAGRSGAVVAGLPYGAAKTGINGVTRTLAPVLGPFGITVNSIAPGWIMTPMTDFAPPEVQQRRIESTPVRRPGRPEDIGGLVSYLCSDDAEFLTGDTIDMNGGSYMAP